MPNGKKFVMCADAEGTDIVGEGASADEIRKKMGEAFDAALKSCGIKSVWELDDAGNVIGGAFLAPYTRNVTGWITKGGKASTGPKGLRSKA